MFWFITAVVSIGTLCWWIKRTKYSVWTKQNVPGPLALPFIGNALRLLRAPFNVVDTEDFKKYGPIFGIYTGTVPTLMVNDAEIIKLVTIKDAHIFPNRQQFTVSDPVMKKFLSFLNGEDWKKGRKVVSPIFSTGKLKKMHPIIELCANEAVEAFGEKEQLKDIDIKAFWGYFSLNVIAKCCFATNLNAYKDPESEFVQNVRSFFRSRVRMMLITLLPSKLVRALGIGIVVNDSVEFFSNVIEHLLKKRTVDGYSPDDYLKLLVDAKNEAVQGSDANSIQELVDDNFIKAQSILFFAAGFETIATLLGYASYCLAIYPDVQKTLHEELTQLKQPDGSLAYDDLIGCKYLDAFISETLRFYSPALRVERMAEEDYTIPGTNMKIPKGSMVAYNPYCIHHNPYYYPDPEEFNPERFMPENSDLLVPNTYLPFGSGPRNCIAMRFALLEAKLAISRTVLECQFVRTKNTKVPLEFDNDLGVLKAKSLLVAIKKRMKN